MSRPTLPTRRVALAGATGLLAFAAFTGCSSDTTDDTTGTAPSPTQTSSSATGTPSEEFCAAVDTAKASLQTLVDTNIAQEGTNTVKARFATFQSDVQMLVEAGQAELAEETAAVEGSLATLEDALVGLAEEPAAADLATVRRALQSVKTSAEDLVAAASNDCPQAPTLE